MLALEVVVLGVATRSAAMRLARASLVAVTTATMDSRNLVGRNIIPHCIDVYDQTPKFTNPP